MKSSKKLFLVACILVILGIIFIFINKDIGAIIALIALAIITIGIVVQYKEE